MDDKIKYFPNYGERSARLSLRKYRVPCQVSMRWLQFPKAARALADGDFMRIYVMTLSDDNKERKLCELVLTKQDLLRMIEQVTTAD